MSPHEISIEYKPSEDHGGSRGGWLDTRLLCSCGYVGDWQPSGSYHPVEHPPPSPPSKNEDEKT